MKKTIAVLLVLMLLCTPAFAWRGRGGGGCGLGLGLLSGLIVGTAVGTVVSTPHYREVYYGGVPYWTDGTYYYQPSPAGYVMVNPYAVQAPVVVQQQTEQAPIQYQQEIPDSMKILMVLFGIIVLLLLIGVGILSLRKK